MSKRPPAKEEKRNALSPPTYRGSALSHVCVGVCARVYARALCELLTPGKSRTRQGQRGTPCSRYRFHHHHHDARTLAPLSDAKSPHRAGVLGEDASSGKSALAWRYWNTLPRVRRGGGRRGRHVGVWAARQKSLFAPAARNLSARCTHARSPMRAWASACVKVSRQPASRPRRPRPPFDRPGCAVARGRPSLSRKLVGFSLLATPKRACTPWHPLGSVSVCWSRTVHRNPPLLLPEPRSKPLERTRFNDSSPSQEEAWALRRPHAWLCTRKVNIHLKAGLLGIIMSAVSATRRRSEVTLRPTHPITRSMYCLDAPGSSWGCLFQHTGSLQSNYRSLIWAQTVSGS